MTVYISRRHAVYGALAGGALALAGVPMGRELERAVSAIHDRMRPDGTWAMQNSLNGKMLVDVEEKGKPSKWLTYCALFVLNHFEGARAATPDSGSGRSEQIE